MKIYAGDCLAVLRTLPDCSVDACVTDPPYGLAEHKPAVVTAAITAWTSGDREHVPDGKGFMGRAWDGFVPPPAVWDECLRVLKPGGHLLCFAGTRTVDLMGLSIRLAGFEIRDSIGNGMYAWVQGQGFPKGKSQLKPAWEPILVCRKPFKGSIERNIAEHGTGALNIAGCRVPGQAQPFGNGTARSAGIMGESQPRGAWTPTTAGRWPTNVVFTHSLMDTDQGCEPNCPVAELDQQSGTTTSQGGSRGASRKRSSMEGGVLGAQPDVKPGFGDTGGASRYFPVFKYQAKAPTKERPKVDVDGKQVGWPTVKPLSLMSWLVRLVTPPDGVVLDPFAGTGTTGQAAELEGFASVLIERDELALRLIRERLGEVVEIVEYTDLLKSHLEDVA